VKNQSEEHVSQLEQDAAELVSVLPPNQEKQHVILNVLRPEEDVILLEHRQTQKRVVEHTIIVIMKTVDLFVKIVRVCPKL